MLKGFVRVAGPSSDECLETAARFFRDVARDRPGFTMTAVVTKPGDPYYHRHLTVIRGALVVSGGTDPPKLYET